MRRGHETGTLDVGVLGPIISSKVLQQSVIRNAHSFFSPPFREGKLGGKKVSAIRERSREYNTNAAIKFSLSLAPLVSSRFTWWDESLQAA